MINYRTAARADFPAIIRIWREAFRDSAEGLNFLERYYSPVSSFVADDGGAVIAMAHLVYGGTYCGVACPYLYAVAVRSDKRGLGLGKGITLFAVQEAHALGYAAIAACPEQPSLTEFYRKLGFTHTTPLNGDFRPTREMLRYVSFMDTVLVRYG
ncbi:MAG: GNAT family N-acetyltransferase [Oscillospiraceae bacterium]|jgi:predicted N-acetyltransferase YhbS|nr:GNAT family N-acetyltransferase [Oscillospiraceae bacterium]